MEFKTPWVLLLVPIAAVVLLYLYRRQNRASFDFSSLNVLESIGTTWKIRFAFVPFVLRATAVIVMRKIAVMCFMVQATSTTRLPSTNEFHVSPIS